jgi:MOSC domain-containing protein YiiM
VIIRESALKPGVVIAVSAKSRHGVNKANREVVRLIAGEGVEGDAHCGATVKHRSRWRRDPTQPNIRQVHLMHAELHEDLAAKGFVVTPGLMGENVTTRSLDLLALPAGARLRLGAQAVVQVTGLRNPCYQLDQLQPGLMAACLDKTADGQLIRKAGVMAVVLSGGEVRAGDPITVELPEGPHERLKPV